MAKIRLKQVDGIGRVEVSYALAAFIKHCQLKNLAAYSENYSTSTIRISESAEEEMIVHCLDELLNQLFQFEGALIAYMESD